MSDIIENADKTVTGWFDNKYLVGILVLLLVIYASYGVNQTSPYILRLFDMPLVKLLLLLLIVYFARLNPAIAIIAAIAFLVTLQVLAKMKAEDNMIDLGRERMEDTKKEETVVTVVNQGEASIQTDTATDILNESKECIVPLQYRNSFYPEYNVPGSDGREERNSNSDLPGFDTALGNPEINGYDPNSNYAAL